MIDSSAFTQHSNYRYHIEMMMDELRGLRNKPRDGDTRIYLSLDQAEADHLAKILAAELAVIDRVLANRP